MSDQIEYYAEDIKKLVDRVNKCNVQILDSLVFFMQEADAHMTGLSDDVMTNIKYEVDRYKKDCRCKRSSPKKLEEIETAEEFIMRGYAR